MKFKKIIFIYYLLHCLNIKLSLCFIGDFQTYVSFVLNVGDKATRTVNAAAGQDVSEDYETNM